MRLPHNLATEWDHFVGECCLGTPPAEHRGEVTRAFDTLRRLWPERLAAAEASGQSGLLLIAPLITLGLVLADTEGLSGFGPVFTRLKDGEPSAGAELSVAACLVRLGYPPTLEPALGGSVLDSVITCGGRRVYLEVISPDTSAEMRATMEDISRLALKVVANTTGTHSELLLGQDPEDMHDAIVGGVAATPVDESVHDLPGVGSVRRNAIVPGVAPDVGPKIPNADPRPVLATAQGQFDQTGGTSATVRIPMTDERAHRLLSAELHHFSRDEPNLLVVRLTRVPGGLGWWLPLVNRWFQPGRNTRVGAVALYEEGLIGTPMATSQRWRVIANPFARVPLPDAPPSRPLGRLTRVTLGARPNNEYLDSSCQVIS